MLICTYYTPSHAEMAANIRENYRACGFTEYVEWTAQQTCPSASFKQSGWNQCTAKKLLHLSDMPADYEKVLFVDADVAIFPGLAEWCSKWLDDNPGRIGFGDDLVQKCTGVILFERTYANLDWFLFCHNFCEVMNQNDQDGMAIIEQISSQINPQGLPADLTKLPGSIVSNWATIGNKTIWDGERIKMPDSTLLWHANWCVGVENKQRMLDQVISGKQHQP